MATYPKKKALIIGGGIAGPAAAMALQRAGIESTIFEARTQAEQNKGAFLTVARNGMNALRTLDAFESVMARGFWVARMEIYSGTGKRLGEMGSNAFGIALERGQLASALCDEAIRRGIPLEMGKRLIDVQATPSGITVQFEDGTQASGDLLVGADGIYSRVRNVINAGAPTPSLVGLIGVGGWARVPGIRTASDTFTFILGKRAFFGWISSPRGEIYWFANIPSSLYDNEVEEQRLVPVSRQEWKQRLLELFAHDSTPAVEIIRSTAEQDGFNPALLDMMANVPHWHRESMVLVGDAAHATSPTSGQGASLALEDSIILAKALRDNANMELALTVYEALRRSRVEKVAKLARRANLTKVAGPILRSLQDLLLPVVFKYVVRPEAETWLYQYRIDWDEQVRKEVEITS
jgi:2-polyprenyl-6-methoxyphenol hydroxylase-like FAD-dependent oxidoreductase